LFTIRNCGHQHETKQSVPAIHCHGTTEIQRMGSEEQITQQLGPTQKSQDNITQQSETITKQSEKHYPTVRNKSHNSQEHIKQQSHAVNIALLCI
jgi:hypothetical protein